MHITNHSISTDMNHSFVRTEEEKEALKSWVGERPDFEGTKAKSDSFLLSDNMQKKDSKNSKEIIPLSDKQKQILIILEKLFNAKKTNNNFTYNNTEININLNNTANEMVGWGMEYDYYSRIEEFEKLDYSASGSIKLADGRNIDFNSSLSMLRNYSRTEELHIRAGDGKPIDPLVLSLDGRAPRLSHEKSEFDLDNDGTKEKISNLGAGNALLVLDRNGNNSLDNGGELFGPNTGNGFFELSKFDEDKNGFIDEGDSIYKDLKLAFNFDEKSPLVKLSNASVGAIYLGAIDTPFSFKDNNNETQAVMKSNSFFIKESGQTGSISQIDFIA